MKTATQPTDYPNTANSGIFEADRFSFGESLIMHIPANFPDANKVTAKCGTYGWVVEHDTRTIHYASGYFEGQTNCTTCVKRSN